MIQLTDQRNSDDPYKEDGFEIKNYGNLKVLKFNKKNRPTIILGPDCTYYSQIFIFIKFKLIGIYSMAMAVFFITISTLMFYFFTSQMNEIYFMIMVVFHVSFTISFFLIFFSDPGMAIHSGLKAPPNLSYSQIRYA